MSKRICIFGDSIAWGAVDPQNGGWVTLLRRYFETNDYDIGVYNQSISGDNTDDLIKRFKVEAEAREPQIIIFAIGINDSQYVMSKDNPRISIEKFQNNLEELINQANKISSSIIFIGLTNVDESLVMPIPWDTRKFYDNENIAKYNTMIKETSSKHELPCINLLDLLKKEDFDDGLHPDTKGHEKMFLKIKESLTSDKLI